MHFLSPKRALAVVSLFVILSLLAACGLSTEPEVVGEVQRPSASPLPMIAPPAGIDLARGEAIFSSEQGCVPCHGDEGHGDGPVAASFPCEIPDLSDAQTRQVSVEAWYAIVSFGKTEQPGCVMPPWNRRLNEAERWDVASYIYRLKYTPDLLSQGEALFAENCAECHGSQGRGDGAQAADLVRRPANFSDPAVLSARSDAEIRQVLLNGIPALGEGAHRFADRLDETEQWAVVAFARSLAWENAGGVPQSAAEVAPAPTAVSGDSPAAPAEPSELTVQGALRVGTQGAQPPEQQTVTLRVLELTENGAQDVDSFEAQTGPDGAYQFEGVPRGEGLTYILTTEYEGVLQFSEPVRAGSEAALDLPLTVYAVTNDASVIRADLLRLFVEFEDANSAIVQQAARYVNDSDRIFVSGQSDASGRDTSLRIYLPLGAQNVSVNPDLGANFSVSRDEAGNPIVLGAFPVFPGASPVFQASYRLPVSEGVALELDSLYPVDSFVLNIPHAEGVTFDDRRFTLGTPVELDAGTYDTFTLENPLPAGEGITLRVTLAPIGGGARRDLIIGIVIGVGVVLGGTLLLSVLGRRRKPAEGRPGESDALVQAIAALDARYEAKEISAKAYRAERARLKAQLAQRIGRGTPQR